MNLLRLPNRFRRGAKLPGPEGLLLHAARHLLEQGLETLVSREPQSLEVKISDDFDTLPRETAEDFWAEAFGESPASRDVRAAAGMGAYDRARGL